MLKNNQKKILLDDKITQLLISLGEVDSDDVIVILDPFAEHGNILKAIRDIKGMDMPLFCCELNKNSENALRENPHNMFLCNDFLKLEEKVEFETFERIITTLHNDSDYIDKTLLMYKFLTPNGILISIIPNAWDKPSNNKEIDFKVWFNSVVGEKIMLNDDNYVIKISKNIY